MEHKLPTLPYAKDALEPYISRETLDYHYGKHHNAYVTNLNNLIKNTEYESMSLEEIIRSAPAGGLFNNAAQVWNHSFYWNVLHPIGRTEPVGDLKQAIIDSFGSFEDFKSKFTQSAVTNFGSGWTWLVQRENKKLKIVNTGNAGTVLNASEKALLTCDVWEHAYYIDYRNARPAYLEVFWKLVNWDFVESNL